MEPNTFRLNNCSADVPSCLQDPEKEVSDWLSDLTLVDQQPDLEVQLFVVGVIVHRRDCGVSVGLKVWRH